MPLFTVETTITKSDYHKFLYITAFFKRPFRILFLVILAAVWAALVGFSRDLLMPQAFAAVWAAAVAAIVAIQCVEIELRFRRRVATDNTGFFGGETVLEFFDDKLSAKSEPMGALSSMEYDKFYALYESRDYFMFYLNDGQASIIRKCDIPEQKALTDFLKVKFAGRYKKIALV